jgi:hypothetical protein
MLPLPCQGSADILLLTSVFFPDKIGKKENQLVLSCYFISSPIIFSLCKNMILSYVSANSALTTVPYYTGPILSRMLYSIFIKYHYLHVFLSFHNGEPSVHRSPHQDQVWLSHHHGGGEKITITFTLTPKLLFIIESYLFYSFSDSIK